MAACEWWGCPEGGEPFCPGHAQAVAESDARLRAHFDARRAKAPEPEPEPPPPKPEPKPVRFLQPVPTTLRRTCASCLREHTSQVVDVEEPSWCSRCRGTHESDPYDPVASAAAGVGYVRRGRFVRPAPRNGG